MRALVFPLCALTAFGAAADLEFFETRVRPVLARECYRCHGADRQSSALRVDSRESLLQGGHRGPAIVAGKPEESLLLKAIRHEGPQMPAGGARLKDTEIAAIEEWIRKGAPWPAATASGPGSSVEDRFRKLARVHWAFQPVRPNSAPLAIDASLKQALGKAGLTMAPHASRRVVLRRLSFVLTGLPPSSDLIDRFVADQRPDAYERAVDDLLASPRFGEHWARHWMDLVRYGETRGYEWNYEILGAWRYRDYLIRAFNADLPYDQFVREHIAGDLLDRPRINHTEGINESIIGPAFYRLGEAGHDNCIQFREIATDVVDNQIDTVGKIFLGLTISCARCHDHKIDPIATEDYYSLYSILNSSRHATHTIDAPEVNAAAVAALRSIKRDLRRELASQWMQDAGDLARYIRAQAPGAPAHGLDPKRSAAWHAALHKAQPALEDPAYAWSKLSAGGAAAFASLATEYQKEAANRTAFNRANFEPFEGWHAAGMGLREAPARSRAGDFAVNPEGTGAVLGVYPAGLYTHLDSQKLNGALRSPLLPKTRKYVSIRAMGGSLASRRTVVDNCAIGEGYKIFEPGQFSWIKLATDSEQKQLPVFLELLTRSDNPRIPDRPGVLKPEELPLIDSPRSYFGFTEAVLHDVNETPREELSHMMPLFEGETPADWDAVASRFASVIGNAIERWSAGQSTDDDARWLDWLVRNNLITNRSPLVERYRAEEENITPARVVEGLADIGPGRDFPALIAGNPKNPGPPAPRRLLRFLFGDEAFPTQGSGRRELAELLASRANPLTARVMVNRVWHHVFGRGLVATVDNFGILGDRPSHPELLDQLAARFVNQGWSIKKLIRSLVLTEAFRQSGDATPGAREVDPQNALLHHYPLRRLGAEALRDAILSSSGKLNGHMYGPGVDPFRDKPQDYRRLFSGPLDGAGRRSVYTKITRMEGPKFLEIFDYPVPMQTRGSRDVTNVPAQALALMNDPFVIAEAETSARRLIESPAVSLDDRVSGLFRRLLGRVPDASERDRFRGLALEVASLHRVPKDQILASVEVWRDVAHALYNLKEFLYIQ